MTKHISELQIGDRLIGKDHPVYIIAEMSANHHHDFDTAVEVLKAAKECGADAVKLQTYTPDTMTIQSSADPFMISGGTPWDGKTLYDLYKEACMPWEWQPRLKEIGEEQGLNVFSTAFDISSLNFLEDQMRVLVHKVSSFENVDLPLIKAMAKTGKPLIISTGMATLTEVEEAVQAARAGGARQIALLKCTSAYPSQPEDMNLRTIPDLEEKFSVLAGLSDHTLGIEAPIAAVALGACIVEKHFTLSRDIPGPDSAFSLEPREFKTMVASIRVAERAIGDVHYGVTDKEKKSRIFRRSLFVVKHIYAGDLFTSENIRSIRPGFGLPPKYFDRVIGGRASKDIEPGTPVSWDLVS